MTDSMTEWGGFFLAAAALGIVFAGLAGVIAALRRRTHWDYADGVNFRRSLELSISGTVFALIPFPVSAALEAYSAAGWRLTSLLLAAILFVHIVNNVRVAHRYRTRWLIPRRLHLVVSVFFLTIEGINAALWSSPGVYALGVAWLIVLAGLQFIAFSAHDFENIHRKPNDTPLGILRERPDERRATAEHQRVRPVRPAGDPNRATHTHPDFHHHTDAHTRPGQPDRQPNGSPAGGDRRTVTDAPFRTDSHPVIRPDDPDARRV